MLLVACIVLFDSCPGTAIALCVVQVCARVRPCARTTINVAHTAVFQVLLGETLLKQGRIVEALVATRRAIELGRKDGADSSTASRARARYNAGVILSKLQSESTPAGQRMEEALSEFSAAIALQPGYGKALANRANLLSASGRYAEAIVDADRAVQAMPDLPQLQTLANDLRRTAARKASEQPRGEDL